MIRAGEKGVGMVHLTCKNHTGAKYLTKNPYQRGLHFIQGDPSVGAYSECPCPFSALVVVAEERKEGDNFRMVTLRKPVPVKEYKFRNYS